MESSAAPVLEDSQPPPPVDSFAGGRASPDEVRASLEAVRLARETARARARRETNRARMIVVGLMAALGLVAWNVSSRRPHKTQAPAPVVTQATMIAPPLPAQPVETAPVVAVAAVPTGIAEVGACDSAYAERRWQSVATACAAAFKVRQSESALAMRVAQAQHRRGYYAAAGEWARNAIALDANLAEAFPILARAEMRAGHPQAAARAYRRYLALAPHGWHAVEARRALARPDGRRGKTADAL